VIVPNIQELVVMCLPYVDYLIIHINTARAVAEMPVCVTARLVLTGWSTYCIANFVQYLVQLVQRRNSDPLAPFQGEGYCFFKQKQ
jgi:hypothetical protein